MPEPAGPLGAAINRALEDSGMTIEQVSAETRIRATLIRDLAAGRTASSGGDVYARGHLKALAHATGTDPAPLLEAYSEVSGVPEPAPLPTPTVTVTGRRVGSLALPTAQAPERRGPHWLVAAVVAVVVLVGLIAIGTLRGGGGGNRGGAQALEPGPSSSATASPSPSASPGASVPPPSVGPDAVAGLPPATGAALRVRVIGGSSWVLVKSGATKVFEGLLADGTVKDFNDPAGLEVKVGNAGVVSLICGGKDVMAGGSGQVKSFTCAPSGLAPV